MAQTGNFSPIQLYSSSTPGNAPAVGNLVNSTLGSELAINIADGKLFYKDSSNAIQVIAWKTTPTTAGGTGLTSYSAGDMAYYASGTALSKLTIGTSGYFMTSSGSAPQWTNPTTVAVTSLSFGTTGLTPSTATKGAITVAGKLATGYGGTGLTSFTSGGIPYATSTSALTTGSALQFSGANLGIGAAASGWGASYNALQIGQIAFWTSPGTALLHLTNNVYFDGSNYKYIVTDYATDHYTYQGAYHWRSAPSGTTGANISSFSDNMVLDASGNLLVGTSSVVGKLTVVGTGTALAIQGTGAGVISQIGTTDTSGNPYLQLYLTDTSTNRGSVQYNRGTGFMLYNTTSDIRLKKNIKTVNEVGNIIDQINIVSHDWKDGKAHSDYSVIAQQLYPIVPQAVSKGDDGEEISELWQVDHSKLVPLLVKEIQSLRARLKTANIA
ncbi:Intramolecular chaperone auto-processing domain containing protein [uncultured Caudovirales phage]|uniref:Intramolecular chaperone auto-processing domain containing protein n=1 Tax=uncultured Caudovirales phage TaxID=2100421 RepID=A0A6J5N0M0_9CAUD|nr:Intramolecular chaperone auto-processing domain containing protein [uncultured Caudovirales phage]